MILPSKRRIGFYLGQIGAAYEIEINDHVIFKSGVVKKKDIEEQADFGNKHFYYTPLQKELLIKIRSSNENYHKSGIEIFLVGGETEIETEINLSVARTSLVTGFCLLFTLMFLIMFALSPHLRFFYQAMISISFALYMILTIERFGISGFNYEIVMKITFLSFVIPDLFFLLMIKEYFSISKFVFYLKLTIFLLIFSLVIVTPFSFYIKLTTFYYPTVLLTVGYELKILISAFLQRKKNASIILLSSFFPIFSAINDILLAKNLINSIQLVPYGFILFVIGLLFLSINRFIDLEKAIQTQKGKILKLIKREEKLEDDINSLRKEKQNQEVNLEKALHENSLISLELQNLKRKNETTKIELDSIITREGNIEDKVKRCHELILFVCSIWEKTLKQEKRLLAEQSGFWTGTQEERRVSKRYKNFDKWTKEKILISKTQLPTKSINSILNTAKFVLDNYLEVIPVEQKLELENKISQAKRS